MGYSDRKQQEKAIRRKDIVDAAERVFAAKGFENASMDEVAEQAEFSKRTVYIYFNSKEQLYFEVMIRGYRLLIGMIEAGFNANPPNNAIEELHVIFVICVKFSRDYPQYSTAIMEYETKDADDQRGVPDESKAECYRLGEVLFGYLSGALHRGVVQGRLRKGLDSEQAALTFWACAIGVYNTATKKGGYLKRYHGIEPDDFISDSFRLMMLLIGTEASEGNDTDAQRS